MAFKHSLVLRAAPVLAPLLVLAGCNSFDALGDHVAATVGIEDSAPKSYSSSVVSQANQAGIAVADEPLAASAGASALTSQGTAVDAVTTMFFALSATYPVAAGLGAGGICLVRDVSGQVTEFDFLSRAPSRGGAYAVPGAVRGFSDMQKQFGALPWQRVVAPGEAYAATGFPLSQALSVRLAAAQNVVQADAGLAAEFLSGSGQPLAVGSEARNPMLGQTLGQIRLSKADGFYTGLVAGRIEAWSNAQGGAVTLDELAAVRTTQGPARARPSGNFVTWLPGPRTGAGAFTAALMDNLARQGSLSGTALSTATSQALAGFGVSALPRDMGSTGFAAVDSQGQAAACAITLNGPFGAGRTAAGTGVQLAASPVGQAGLASAFLAPLIATDAGSVAMAVTGSGGPNGTAAAVMAALEGAGGRQLGKRGDLRGTGAAPFDTVNVVSCNGQACVALTDPGAHGGAAVGQ